MRCHIATQISGLDPKSIPWGHKSNTFNLLILAVKGIHTSANVDHGDIMEATPAAIHSYTLFKYQM